METDYRSFGDELKEIRRLSEENNRILKAMRRDALIGMLFQVLIWVLVVGGSAYFTLQYLEPLLGSFTEGGNGGSLDVSELLKQYQSLLGE